MFSRSMQAKKRYLTVCLCGVIIFIVYRSFSWFLKNHENEFDSIFWSGSRSSVSVRTVHSQRSFLDHEDIKIDKDTRSNVYIQERTKRSATQNPRQCSMETCFDMSRCEMFKVYVYPIQDRISESYNKVLTALKEQRYYTPYPNEACLFILSVDTLDRDTLSNNYENHANLKISNLKLWNGGQNHIIFNLYSGTWPDYAEDLGFDIGMAMLAKASFSVQNFRSNYDISLPLFSQDHPLKGGAKGRLSSTIPSKRAYLLGFKGKRYLTGIGSETRNALYHIHNGKDIILLTTCKHGKDWRNKMDKRCLKDNAEYDKWDYKNLLLNSTFCLVPRGRRLGSFRFLESLQQACIPVLLSNDWELPFSEIIDWKRAAIWADERLLLQVPTIVRSILDSDILTMQQYNIHLWDTYFSSIEKIAATVVEIIKDRVHRERARSTLVWNTVPGGLAVLHEFSQDLRQYPFYIHQLGANNATTMFTAIIYCSNTVIHSATPLYRLVRNVGRSSKVHKILIVWNSSVGPPSHFRWPVAPNVPLLVILNQEKTISSRFYPYESIETAAVLSLDDDALLTTDEVDFAFSVWGNFPDRIVGYPARSHYWDEERSRWGYSSKWTNEYSIILTGAAFIHRYYLYLYTNQLPSALRRTVDQSHNCEDLLINFLVAHLTKRPPLKLTQRKIFKDSVLQASSPWLHHSHFIARQTCMNIFVNYFGYMPLVRSGVRLDPVLFKDQVSRTRKKYKQIELVKV